VHTGWEETAGWRAGSAADRGLLALMPTCQRLPLSRAPCVSTARRLAVASSRSRRSATS
jgi:hypothetical protein